MKEEVIKLLVSVGVEKPMAESLLEIPPDPAMGDFAFPCFKLAGIMKKNPMQIAKELEGKLKLSNGIERVVAVGPYLNFFVDKEKLVAEVLEKISAGKEKFGSSARGKGKTIVIDFSSPNIAKPFNITHLRSTVIGNALYRIFSALGYKTLGVNHLGDWGTQFGKLIVAYKRWGKEKELEKEPIKHLLKIYVQFHEEAEKDSSLDEEARKWFKRLEEGDKEATALWKRFKELSLKEFNQMYKRMRVHFDSFNGESFYNDKMEAVIKEAEKKKLVKESEEALIVDLGEKMPPLMLRKSDEATTYATRDLAAAIYRLNEYKPEKVLYVVGAQQNLHFQQLFKTLELMGYPAEKFVHVNFGTMSFAGRKLSTRKGEVIFLEDVFDEAVKLAGEIIKKKNPALKNKKEMAEAIGLGAVFFWDLSNDRVNDIVFDWQRVLDFEGDTAPYVQYTHARACAILRKAGKEKGKADYALLKEPEEVELAKALDRLPDIVQKSAEEYKPHHVAKYLLDVCHLFNEFYHKHQVLVEDEKLKSARLSLVSATKQVLANGLYLLGIKAPEEM